ncbi:MAG: glycosyltransferase [Burkholderiales bacterium]|nr:glycosyltransferase [Burkholderiales bacterium]
MIDIVSATRLSESDFWSGSALGISLRRLEYDNRLVPRVAFANRRGLPEIYNERISAGDSNDILVFIHDDVWIDDYFLSDRIIEGMRTYDVIGVAGNKHKVPHQPAWAFLDTSFTWDDKANLSGSVAHGKMPFGSISNYGKVPAACELLDGVFLAAKKSALKSNGVLFDPRFDFHFYDMDFCRSARQCGLRLGTWPICLTHQSSGAFGTAQWTEKYRAYIEKWGN